VISGTHSPCLFQFEKPSARSKPGLAQIIHKNLLMRWFSARIRAQPARIARHRMVAQLSVHKLCVRNGLREKNRQKQ
jgi:hypothetical protein